MSAKRFNLPLTEDVVILDERGAIVVAFICCALARTNHSAMEAEQEYAYSMAGFHAGAMAMQETEHQKRLFIFNEFLQKVEDVLDHAYPIDGPPDQTYVSGIFEQLGDNPPSPLRTRI